MPSDADNFVAGSPASNAPSGGAAPDERGRTAGAQVIDSTVPPPGSSAGRIGAKPIRWGWWAAGLAVSLGLWWLIVQVVA